MRSYALNYLIIMNDFMRTDYNLTQQKQITFSFCIMAPYFVKISVGRCGWWANYRVEREGYLSLYFFFLC